MTQEVAKAINNVSKRLNEVQLQLDTLTRALSETNSANIDYVAMMTDVELPDNTDKEEAE